ncbi:MAG: hypothetical protein U5K81_03055 [Trueperaceae bacterium]|nr:hypothetical protein [Trueperaceae bacterium]
MRIRSRWLLSSLASLLLAGMAGAAPPCGVLLGGYLEDHDGEVVPCLVDLQEDALCFGLEDMTVNTATRTLDAHLQAQGVPRPVWDTTPAGNATRVNTESGDRLEVVLAADGAFTTMGTCRIVYER